uniref:Uncharacterized protein n=1 Tax=Oryza rufipogon TaxID=4529 RepID=A0A0E0PEQ8_ORYRU
MVTYSPQQRRDAQHNNGEACGSQHGFWVQHSIWLLVEIERANEGISASLEAERRCAPPAAAAAARTGQDHGGAARHLDHTFEKLASAHLQLVVAAPLVDALRGSPTEPLALPDHAHHLPLRLHRRGAFPLSLMLITPAAELLAVTTSPAAAAAGSSEAVGRRQQGELHLECHLIWGRGVNHNSGADTITAAHTGDGEAWHGEEQRRGGGKEGVAAVPAVIVSPLPCTLELASRSSLTGRRRKEEEIKGEL